MRRRFARWLLRASMRVVERIDYREVPRYSGFAFVIREGIGAEINNTGTSSDPIGCPLLYLNNADYDRAFDERPSRGDVYRTQKGWLS